MALDTTNPDSIQEMPFDAVIWCGDFNYRLNGIIGAIVQAMKRDMYEVLLFNDQFALEMKIGRIAWGFEEGLI